MAQSLEPWLSFFNLIPKAHASYGFVWPEGNKYLNHKFSFQLKEAEFNQSETSAKRIEYLQFSWNGIPNRTYADYYDNRYVYLYVWQNNDWEKLDETRWRYWENSDKSLGFKINHNIENYLDEDRKIHFMVETNKKGYDILATDWAELEVKAYRHREDIE